MKNYILGWIQKNSKKGFFRIGLKELLKKYSFRMDPEEFLKMIFLDGSERVIKKLYLTLRPMTYFCNTNLGRGSPNPAYLSLLIMIRFAKKLVRTLGSAFLYSQWLKIGLGAQLPEIGLETA